MEEMRLFISLHYIEVCDFCFMKDIMALIYVI